MKGRIERLRQRLVDEQLDAVLISTAENRRYLSGFTGSAGFLLISKDLAVLATDFRYLEQAAAQAPDYNIFRTEGELPQWFPTLAPGLVGAGDHQGELRLGFEADNLSVSAHQGLADCLKELAIRLVPTRGLVEGLRAVKDADELDTISRAIALGDEAFEFVAARLEPGMTELQVAWELERYMRERGSQALPFEIIVAAGPHSSLPHARPTDRPIGEGEPIVIDMGAKIEGYISDLTRTLCLGQPDATFRRVRDLVLGAQLTAEATIQAGMTGEEAHNLALKVIADGGHGDAFGHGLGHGVGLEVHEQPRLGPRSPHLLAEGMVFSIEPGIYLPGWGGVRIEDLVVLQNGRVRVLSKASKEENMVRRG